MKHADFDRDIRLEDLSVVRSPLNGIDPDVVMRCEIDHSNRGKVCGSRLQSGLVDSVGGRCLVKWKPRKDKRLTT